MTKFKIIKLIFVILLLMESVLFYLHADLFVFWLGISFTIICYGLTLFCGAYFIQLNFFVKAFNKGSGRGRKLVLTFDDGPHENTLRILAILEKFDAKATFFIIGKHVNGREYILEKIVEKGHLIGNHSYEHDTLYSLQAASWIHADIQKNNDLLTDLIHQQIRWFRPPYGVTNPSIGKALQTLPIDVIGWNIRSLDTSISDPHQVLQRIIKRLKGEDILLLHDTMENTALILEALLLYCKENNIDIVPLSQLIDSTPYA